MLTKTQVITIHGTEIVALPQDLNLPVGKYQTDDFFDEVSTLSAWLPRLQLFTTANKEVKTGKINMNHYGLVLNKDQIIDCTKQVEVVPLAWRPKAMQFLEKKVISKYNPDDPEFKRIAQLSEVKDARAMYGPEFLIYVPLLGKFASFFMASKSARRESPAVKEALDRRVAITLDSKFIETAQYSWWTPSIKGCSNTFVLPSNEEILAEVQKFGNPPESEIEVDPDSVSPQPQGQKVQRAM